MYDENDRIEWHGSMARWRVEWTIAMVVGAAMLVLLALGCWKAWELVVP